jgi:hypothetical protein
VARSAQNRNTQAASIRAHSRRGLRPGKGPPIRKLRFEQLEDRRLLATYTVTSLSDFVVSGAGSAPGTLRQAVYDANHSSEADVIEFAANLSGDINLSIADDTGVGASAFLITSEITIHGNANGITIKRDTTADNMRLFRVTVDGNLTLDSITLSGGLAHGANGASGQQGGAALGGAAYNEGVLSIVSCTLYENSAIGGDAGATANGGSAQGGAIYNDGGAVSIHNSTISGNSAVGGSGVSQGSSFGGAMYVKNGSLDIYNSTITNNTATSTRDVFIFGVGVGKSVLSY